MAQKAHKIGAYHSLLGCFGRMYEQYSLSNVDKTTVLGVEVTFKRGESQNLVPTMAKTAMLVSELPPGTRNAMCFTG